MARSGIPDGITREDVLEAISALKTHTVDHGFYESERYDLIHEGERFAPKAVIGVAAQRVAGRILEPRDFSGGEGSRCFYILRQLGFSVEVKPEVADAVLANFEVGKEYNRRRDIHRPLGGQARGGISTPTKAPVVILFTGVGGDAFGYRDEFREDGVFLYTGEGQVGDMQLTRGNLAIANSAADGKRILLFEVVRKGVVRYVGRAEYLQHHWAERSDRDGGIRKAIIFELALVGDTSAGETEPSRPPTKLHLRDVRRRTLAELRALAMAVSPSGSSDKVRTTIVHNRALAVREYVLRRANGRCEGCEQPAPFLTRKGEPYLEPHHITRVADGGPDHPAHVIALCPTCHRRVHHGQDGDDLNAKLRARAREIEETAVRSGSSR